jgi:hypothetical protein
VKVGLKRRLSLGIVTLALASLTATPVMAANPTIPTGETGSVAGSGATFPTLLYKS